MRRFSTLLLSSRWYQRTSVLSFAWLVGVAACGPGKEPLSPDGQPPPRAGGTRSESQGGEQIASRPSSAELRTLDDFRKKRRLTVGEARRFMLLLVNRDRATMGLAPVTLDEGAAQRAGDEHARDMAAHGFLGHYGLDGSVPEVRYARAGGHGMVMENASCVTDEQPRGVVANPVLDAVPIEEAEDMYFHEVPPNDGHRKTILRPEAIRVGIGLALPMAGANEIVPPCTSQEFVGPEMQSFTAPSTAVHGGDILIEGEARSFGGIGIARLDLKPLTPAEANARRSYTFPNPSEMFFPSGFKTRVAVRVANGKFSLKLPLRGPAFGPGLFEISAWGSGADAHTLNMLGVRIVEIR